MSTTRRVSVVVCTRDRPELLGGCLAAIGSTMGADDELVVVDSASQNGAAVAAVATTHGARLVRVERPGLSRARNAGTAAALAPLVAFTDDDCRPDPGWIDALVTGFEEADVDFVTGPVDAVGDVRLPVSVVLGTTARRFDATTDPTTCGAGANMAFRATALVDAGGFDEALGAGSRYRAGEDLDMFMRLLHHGHRGQFRPDARMGHVQWRADTEAVALGWNYGLGAGAAATKAARIGAGRQLLRQRLGADGVGAIVRSVRSRHWTGLATSVLQLAGTVVGAAATIPRPLHGERFA